MWASPQVWRWWAGSMLLALLWLAQAGGAALAEGKPLKGVALVIGEARYEHLPALGNPANDAAAMAKELNALGFEVTQVSDLNHKKLKRALENFADDAEGADAAAIYYSGHGIEAGGENWLVPTDADVSSLDDAAQSLVALSPVIERLKADVPVTLLFLDACRSSPFPAGAVLKTGGAGAAVSAGLAAGKGVTAVDAGAAQDGIGTVIGFAAEPGHVALDGPKEGNSPYAAALLRHLSAMGGAEFGTVMRLVTEEVYLKTQGQQRPWVNETLTKLLYFGGAPASDLEGDGGRILSERRKLLLTIAGLPEVQRGEVEQAARAKAVPMDALYGLLRSLGTAAPADPEALARLLDAQAERLRVVLSEQQALHDPDPEIQRLSQLAAEALHEGALDASIAFWDKAKARYAEVAKTLDVSEAQLKTRRLEGGQLLARSAEARELAADYKAAAADFLEAFAQVEKWDSRTAWLYKRRAADAWLSEGDVRGDGAALDRAVALYADALTLAPRDTAPLDWGLTQNDLGDALLLKAQRSAGDDGYAAAIAALKRALEVRTRDAQPRLWAKTQNNLALALGDLAARRNDKGLREEAIAAYRAALSETPRAEDPDTWATIIDNLGNALTVDGPPYLEEAVAAHRAALEVRDRSRVPLDWARSQINLGNALAAVGKEKGDVALVDQSIAAYRLAIEEQDRARFPQPWAAVQYNIGTSYLMRGGITGSAGEFHAAAQAFQLALEVRRFDSVPIEWAETQYNLGRALQQAGHSEHDGAALRAALDAYTQSLRVYDHAARPADWAETQFSIGNVQSDLAGFGGDTAARGAAIAAFRNVLTVRTRAADGTGWADAQFNLGNELRREGLRLGDAAMLGEAAQGYRQALLVYTRERNAADWADTQEPLAETLSALGSMTRDTAMLAEAIGGFESVLRSYDDKTPRKIVERARQFLADSHYNLGLILRRAGLEKKDAALTRQAAGAFQSALAFYTRERNAMDWADTELQLADTLTNLRLIAPGRAVLDQSLAAYRAVLEVLTAEANPALWRQAKLGLSLALYELGIETKSADTLRAGRREVTDVIDHAARQGAAAGQDQLTRQVALFDAALAALAP